MPRGAEGVYPDYEIGGVGIHEVQTEKRTAEPHAAEGVYPDYEIGGVGIHEVETERV